MKKILFLALMAVMAMTAMAQNRTITGRLVDKETKEPMVQTTVQLLTADSTFVTGGVTNEKG